MKAIFRHEGKSIDHTPASAVAAGDVVVLGSSLVTISKLDIAANALGALAVTGVFTVVKDDSDISGPGPAYWDADGDPVGGEAGTGAFTSDSALGPFAGWFLAAAGTAVGTVLMALNSRDAAVTLARSALVQEDEAPYAIPISAFRVWDAPSTVLPAIAGNDDLGVINNTFLTGSPSIETGDVKQTQATRKARFQFPVPQEYVAGQTITLRVNAGMKTTVATVSATLDAEVVRTAVPGTDLCATAAQSINSLVAADKDFTITPTDVVPGDLLDVVLTVDTNDDASGTAVIGKINDVTLLLDVKG